MNFLILNGTNSNTIPGLIISSLPPITKPEMRVAIDEIDGKDGDQITKLGYSAYDKEIEIGLSYNYDVNQVLAFFNTEGIVTFSNEPDKYYRYTIVDQIDLEKLIRFKTAKVTMHVQPFKYELTEEEKKITATETSFEGTNIQITGSEFGGLITDQKHKGQTSQYTTTGKNKLAIKQLTTQTINGVTFTPHYTGNKLDYVNANGTATATAGYFLDNADVDNVSTYTNELPGGTYILDDFSGSSSVNTAIFFRYKTSGSTFTTINSVDNSRKLTMTGTFKYTSYIRINSGTTVNNMKFYPQLETGSTQTTYEPFTDGPAPNPSYPQQVKVVTGSNTIKIYNKNLIENETFVQGSAGESTGTKRISLRNIKLKANTTYTLSSNLDFSIFNMALATSTNQFPTPSFIYDSGWRTANFSFTTGNEDVYANIVVKKIGELVIAPSDVASYHFQIEKGTTATSYVKHYEQEYELNLGKNLFNKDDAQIIHAWFLKTSTAISITSGNDTIVYIPCRPNTTYTASKIQEPNQSKNTLVLGTTTTQPTNNTPLNVKEGQQGGTITEVTITTGPNDHYLCAFCYSKADANTYSETEILASLQIEEGSQATNYASYFPPIELVEIGQYRDYIYERNEKWWKRKEIGKIAIDETYNWIRETSSTWVCPRFYCATLPDLGTTVNGTVFNNSLCNMATVGSTSDYTQNENVFLLRRVNNTNRIDCMFDLVSVDDLKNILAEENMLVYYCLITPIEEEITYEPLIEQLNAIKDARLYNGITNIITEGNLPVRFSGKTYTTESTELTIENEGNIYARPKLTLTGIGDISIYLNGSQIFILNLDREAPETIIIDCENMDAFYDGVLKNRKVTGDYSNFKLQPGNNQIAVSGSVAELKVETYSRWL